MTTTRHWERLDDLFARAVELAPAERDALVSRECADDPELARDLTQLLAHVDSPRAAALDAPSRPTLRARIREASEDALEDRGGTCGPYRLLRRLGAGGMGTVYLAVHSTEDAGPVALKKLRSSVTAPSFAMRLRTERELLASLDHPGIARFLDSGEDQHGSPYYVMEYVDGTTLTEHCDGHALDLRARVEIVAKVADAMAHAHRRLVVHRDLKPANVLVTRDGHPKIVDFGIAKLIAMPGTESARAMGTSTRVLTPDYCSPEQARGERITTASDVYSLGVILHELLTGSLPTATASVAPAIADRPPTRMDLAFVRIADPDRQRAIVARRSSTTGRLLRDLRGDLANIVAKALAAVPERRYASADALAEDLRRWLHGLPVAARRDGVIYRLRKFVRRNRLAALALTAAGLTATIGAVGVLWQSRIAEQEAIRASEATDLLIELLADAVPDPESLAIARTMWQRAQRLLESRAQLDLGTRTDLFHALGRFQSMAGDFDAANQTLTAALDLAEAGHDEVRMLAVRSTLAGVMVRRGDFDAVVPMLESLCAQAHESKNRKVESESRIFLGDVLRLHGRAREAIEHTRIAVTLRRDLETFRPRDLANALNAQCAAHFSLREIDRCEELALEAIAVLDRAGTRDSLTRSRSLHNLGTIAYWRDDLGTADRYLRDAVQMREAIFQSGHPDLAESRRLLFRVAFARRQFRDAVEHARAEIDILERHTPGHWYIEDARSRLGEALLEAGDRNAAATELLASYARLRELLGDDHEHAVEARDRLAKLRMSEPAQPGNERR